MMFTSTILNKLTLFYYYDQYVNAEFKDFKLSVCCCHSRIIKSSETQLTEIFLICEKPMLIARTEHNFIYWCRCLFCLEGIIGLKLYTNIWITMSCLNLLAFCLHFSLVILVVCCFLYFSDYGKFVVNSRPCVILHLIFIRCCFFFVYNNFNV